MSFSVSSGYGGVSGDSSAGGGGSRNGGASDRSGRNGRRGAAPSAGNHSYYQQHHQQHHYQQHYRLQLLQQQQQQLHHQQQLQLQQQQQHHRHQALDYHSVHSANDSTSSLTHRSAMSMDEAYRRLGHKLSQRVMTSENLPHHLSSQHQQHSHGHDPRHTIPRAGSHPQSAFVSSQQQQRQQHGSNYRYSKVAKLSTSRRDENTNTMKLAPLESGSTVGNDSVPLLKRLTVLHKTTFSKVEASKKQIQQQQKQKQQQQKQQQQKQSKGLLGNMMLSAGNINNNSNDSSNVEPSSTTQSSTTTTSSTSTPLIQNNKQQQEKSQQQEQQQEEEEQRQQKCLTTPAEPVSNDGLDNAEGNLIVFQGDVIEIPSNAQTLEKKIPKNNSSNNNNADEGAATAKQTATLDNTTTTTTKPTTFTVLDMLGQGTFAQVFLCQPSSPDKDDDDDDDDDESAPLPPKVALKVIKNKPAYTRQAAVEIDVFRALLKSHQQKMVTLQQYFMFQNHLCLVFELLGLNLYEVLKKRQFRGLSLQTVKSLLSQALMGIKELSQKSIVHCDLKPENILLEHGSEELLIRDGDPTSGTNTSGTNSKPKDAAFLASTTPNTTDTDPCSSSTSSSNASSATTDDSSSNKPSPQIKLIDFGSACFEGHTSHTYIQSRFYRSPEVLIGLPYDSAIDMWSLGCVAAELFLGLPILPGVHEHDQLGRIWEMIGPLPDWMLEQGSKSHKYFIKQFKSPQTTESPTEESTDSSRATSTWRIKTQPEYISSLSASEIRKKGGLAKLEKQPTNRYFKRKKLADIIMLHNSGNEDRAELGLFTHFLLGILDPDPWKRWTAFQASQHPFVTGQSTTTFPAKSRRHNTNNSSGNSEATSSSLDGDGGTGGSEVRGVTKSEIYWVPPWDPSICRRKLLNVQKTREKNSRRGAPSSSSDVMGAATPDKLRYGSSLQGTSVVGGSGSTSTSRVTAMTDAMSLSRHSHSDRTSPPSSLGVSTSASSTVHTALQQHQQQQQVLPPPHTLTGSLGSVMHAAVHPSSSSFASLTDHSGGVHAMSYGEGGAAGMLPQQVLFAQSYNNSNYVNDPHQQHMLPQEADFAYALQRPGVVPGQEMSGSLSSAAYSPAQHPHHHHHHPSIRSSASASGNRMGGLSRQFSRGSRRVYGMAGVSGASPRFHHSTAPTSAMQATSIREDGSDCQNRSVTSDSSGTSLLAQQLEKEQKQPQLQQRQRQYTHQEVAILPHGTVSSSSSGPSATMDSLHGQSQPRQHAVHTSTASLPPGYIYRGQGLHPQSSSGGYAYTTYVTADGTPIITDIHHGVGPMAPPTLNALPPGGVGYDRVHHQVTIQQGSYGVHAQQQQQQQHQYHHLHTTVGASAGGAYPATYALGHPTSHQPSVEELEGQIQRAQYRGTSM